VGIPVLKTRQLLAAVAPASSIYVLVRGRGAINNARTFLIALEAQPRLVAALLAAP